jgi:hypothetical protein
MTESQRAASHRRGCDQHRQMSHRRISDVDTVGSIVALHNPAAVTRAAIKLHVSASWTWTTAPSVSKRCSNKSAPVLPPPTEFAVYGHVAEAGSVGVDHAGRPYSTEIVGPKSPGGVTGAAVGALVGTSVVGAVVGALVGMCVEGVAVGAAGVEAVGAAVGWVTANGSKSPSTQIAMRMIPDQTQVHTQDRTVPSRRGLLLNQILFTPSMLVERWLVAW